MDRLRAHIIEAAEQCERTALSELAEPRQPDSLLADWPTERTLLFADEQGGTPLAKAAEAGPGPILIGPAGGFTDEEGARHPPLPHDRPAPPGPPPPPHRR